MEQKPYLSVIMPVYNCAQFVQESIESILNQTYQNFELLIIDDHSDDDTLLIVKSFKDSRIIVYEKSENKGMVDSLNFAIKEAKGELIARMDGDDISHPTRFEKQVDMLKNNPQIDLLSANARIPRTTIVYNYATTPEQVEVDLLFGSAFVHASLMGKTKIFLENPFDESMKHAEDYDLWTRLVFKAKMVNMKEVLYDYRAHGNQVSNVYRDIQENNCNLAQRRMFKYLPFDRNNFSDELMDKALRKKISNAKDSQIVFKWFSELVKLNKESNLFQVDMFNVAIDKFRFKFIKYSINNMFSGKEHFSIFKILIIIKKNPMLILRHLFLKLENTLNSKSLIFN